MTAEEIQEVRAFILEQKKKKQAAETRRKRSIEKSSSTLSSGSSSIKAPTAKKAQSKPNKMIQNVQRDTYDEVIESVIKRAKGQMVKHSKEEGPKAIIDAMIDYDEEEDESDDPDPNAVISLGEDEEEYKQKRIERKQRAETLVPEGLLKRAQVLKVPRQGIFIHQCNDCRETQKKRQNFLYKAGNDINFMLTFELCAEDLDKNINLGTYYAAIWADGVLYFRRGANIASGTDYKLLGLLKYCWILHQCDKCISLQRSLASDMFLHKCGEKYELSFMMEQHVADIALEELKEKRRRLARQLEQLFDAEYDEKQLKLDLYAAFIQHHRNRYPQISLSRIHEHFLKERHAMGRQAIVDVVKNELYYALGHTNSKYWGQIDMQSAIDVCCYRNYIPTKKKRENSPVIIMNDITKRLESQLNIETPEGQDLASGGEGTSASTIQDNVSIFMPDTVNYLSTTDKIPEEDEW
uniref:Uncharacterized protein n=1 Tax=Meloidogyne enterolobii TaxID=390850 RepID=A0A6V7XVF3_MELEN|nr:unnamed protein product [Meloidogyne enterolobii]